MSLIFAEIFTGMTENDFIPSTYRKTAEKGRFTWRAPSNIALVKYWGKYEEQRPANPSLSFTLSKCTTTTTLSYRKLPVRPEDFSFDLLFEGHPREDFRAKISVFFQRIAPYFPFLKDYHFTIETANSFPHSSGIASSASSMSALALCIMDLEKTLDPGLTDELFYKKASFTARLGSGSACRSVKGNPVVWGVHPQIPESSDKYGIPYPHPVHEVFSRYQDTILIVSSGEKQVSSSEGHRLMHHHPFAEKRFAQAGDNLSRLKESLHTGNLKSFITVVESEALTLHAMMMTGLPCFILMKPNTLKIINAVWAFRERTGLHPCFTLDAGANVHLLYPKSEKEQILDFINTTLVAYCENEYYICDEVGDGAKKL